ncbi:MAG: hypothetical protein A2498_01970 [Lentisphaerae bacterium RIFOXYC12_FULL_60_16]|nr:MAG: hypothetical protein A2498_01970 [Lentisphaerae bacterium RIFOXYC12_FULL_60_16]OGV84109.1 MAG: hypothetical protein A2340_13570 [Lentisphaerae bacterium RIFOXYB12_FULL_60_10]
MPFFEIVVIGLGLSMDALAISITSGVTLRPFHLRHAMALGCWFGGFQALMPLLGWLVGNRLSTWISSFDHWVVFGVLVFIGCKMIYESFRISEVEAKAPTLDHKVLFVLALATSVDALAVGFSFALLDVAIMMPAIIIGGVTFLVSFCGVIIGDRFGHLFERKAEVLGGLVLIGMGIRILVIHLTGVVD